MKPQPKEETTSPGKKMKVKLPDVEKTLANWARNQQKKCQPITTDELRKQVLMFTSGRSDQKTFTSIDWLERFQRRHLGNDFRSRDREDTAETSTSHSETLDNSPDSSNGLVSPPMSAIEDAGPSFRYHSAEDVFEFDDYEDSPLLPHGFSSNLDTNSGLLISSNSPEMNRDYVSSPFKDETPTEMSFPRQRSMTLPHLAANVKSPPASSAPSIPALPVRSLTTVSEHRQASVDPRQTMKRHKSVPDIHDAEVVRYSAMQPPPLPRSADISPLSIPSTPTPQDETLLALHKIQRLLEQRPDIAEPDDYVMIGKLMEKLKLLRTRSPTGTPILPGGMHRIDSPRLSKKRTVIEMSM